MSKNTANSVSNNNSNDAVEPMETDENKDGENVKSGNVATPSVKTSMTFDGLLNLI